jgi:hypothetical protein
MPDGDRGGDGNTQKTPEQVGQEDLESLTFLLYLFLSCSFPQAAHGEKESCVLHNQYIVFDSSQLRPRFLVQVDVCARVQRAYSCE